jgi:hypothetical protein
MTSACLPRHRAAAYLFLVRRMRTHLLVLAPLGFAALLTSCTSEKYRLPTTFSTLYPTLDVSGAAASQLTVGDISELKQLAKSRSDILKPLESIEVSQPGEAHITSGRAWQRSPQMETFTARKKDGRWYIVPRSVNTHGVIITS